MQLRDTTILHTSPLTHWVEDGIHYFLDGDAPNWVATDPRGAALLQLIDGQRSFADLVQQYRNTSGVESTVAWLHVHEFCQGLVRQRLAFDAAISYPPYPGRAEHLALERLDECWFQVNNECNLACRHCLVESGPKGIPGLPPAQLARLVDEAAELGTTRFYFTGGEPLLRLDLPGLMCRITTERQAELIVLTNGLRFTPELWRALKDVPRELLKFQISIDGATAATNDYWRGKGTFAEICAGAREAAEQGFSTSLTTVVTNHNIAEIPLLPALAREVKAGSYHLMWPHQRGRITVGKQDFIPSNEALIGLVDAVTAATQEANVEFDNWESMQVRVGGLPFMRFDLSNAGWGSLCVGPDGQIYPSPALAGEADFTCGNAVADGIKTHWRNNAVLQNLRGRSLATLETINTDPLRYMIGGGDLDQMLLGNRSDPYYPVYQHLARRVMSGLAEQRRDTRNTQLGDAIPTIYYGMGEGAIASPEITELPAPNEIVVATLHSNCVLSFDVDKPRKAVQAFYGDAAEEPKTDLCCPVKYDPEATAHIPKEVMERFYGCGSPSTRAELRPEETYVDLGSGGGIDCFIAAKYVGKSGKVIGVDMTDQMLKVANENKSLVAKSLGYDVCEFRKGFLEQLPVDDAIVDCITSNCVINLSPDKKAVFREMWRILKNHGRIVIADIVSDQLLPPALKANEHLWGECISGALTQAQFLSALEEAGFYGLQILKKDFWRTVEGYPFYSVTVRGFKSVKQGACQFRGQKAVYCGPGKAFIDEEGHCFPRNVAVEVCTDTAAKLQAEPYCANFHVIDPDESAKATECC